MSEASGAYLVPAASAEAELRERGSRFRALVLPVESEDAAAARRNELSEQFDDATHLCWAQRVGQPPIERSSDAGEPAGTAGRPILQVLRGAALSDVLAVVLRWYGGTKLGKGGLARAYAGAVRAALETLPTAQRVPVELLKLEVDWAQMAIIQRLIHPPEVELGEAEYGERVRLELVVHRSALDPIVESLRNAGVHIIQSPVEGVD